jgi:hypothetical protein
VKGSPEGSRKSSAASKALGDYDEYYVVAEKVFKKKSLQLFVLW